MFHVGQLVVCVDDEGQVGPPPYVRKGTVYTVRLARVGLKRGVRTPMISVEELRRPLALTGFEWGFIVARFRPVNDSALDIFRKTEAPVREDA